MKENFKDVYRLGVLFRESYNKYHNIISNISEEETQDFAAYLIAKYVIKAHPLWPEEFIKYCKFDMEASGFVFTVLLDDTSPNRLDWVWYKIHIQLKDINDYLGITNEPVLTIKKAPES